MVAGGPADYVKANSISASTELANAFRIAPTASADQTDATVTAVNAPKKVFALREHVNQEVQVSSRVGHRGFTVRRVGTPARSMRTSIEVAVVSAGWLVCLSLLASMPAGCANEESRGDAGICYIDEHQNDLVNCGCLGPCADGQICTDGKCTPSCQDGPCPGSCGNGVCEAARGEDCLQCWQDCACISEEHYAIAPGVVVVDEGSPLQYIKKGQTGTILLQPLEPSASELLVPGARLLSNLAHGALFHQVVGLNVMGLNYYVNQSRLPFIDEVFARASVFFQVPIDFSAVSLKGLWSVGAVPSSSTEEPAGAKLDTITISLEGRLLTDVEVMDWQANQAEVTFDVVSGELKLSASPTFEMELGPTVDFPYFSVTKLVAGVELSRHLSFQAKVTVTDRLRDYHWSTGELLVLHAPLDLQAVPGWLGLRGEWRPSLHIDTDEAVQLAIGFAAQTEGLLGVSFQGGQWHSVDTLQTYAEPIEIGASGTAPFEATVSVEETMQVEPWGLAGTTSVLSQGVFVSGAQVFNPLRIAWQSLFQEGVEVIFDGHWFSEEVVPAFSESAHRHEAFVGGDAPYQICGDGIRSGTEECDDVDLGKNSCLTVDKGFISGSLGCDNASCQFDYSACCEPEVMSKCIGAKLFWFDSCGSQGSLRDDCDDSSLCTIDSCVFDQCVHVRISNCCDSALDCELGQQCLSNACVCQVNDHTACYKGNIYWFDSCNNMGGIAASCDDGDICTVDSCSEGECQYYSIGGCCAADDDCLDGKICQQGVCLCKPNVSVTCVGDQLVWVDSCGVEGDVADSCDDNNPCTADSCSGDACTNVPANDGGSCKNTGVCSGGICVLS